MSDSELWGVRDSRATDVRGSVHLTVTEALRAAVASGLDVFLHADDCPPDRPLGSDCPCRPFLLPARKKVLL